MWVLLGRSVYVVYTAGHLGDLLLSWSLGTVQSILDQGPTRPLH